MRLHYPLNSNGAEDAGRLPWTDGVPSTGVEGSYPGHSIVTDAEAEILAAIDASGQARNGNDLTQLVQAIARGVYLGQFGGTANALSAVLPNNVVFASLQRGIRFTGFVTTTNTGGVTVAIVGIGTASGTVLAPLVRRSGAALQAGDLPVAQDFEIRWDGSAFRMAGTVSSDTASTSQSVVTAAKALFNVQQFQTSTRVSMSSPGAASTPITGWSGFAYTKKSATSLILAWMTFTTRSPYAPGQGNSASQFLLTVGGVPVQFTITNAYPAVAYQNNAVLEIGSAASPLPIGAQAVSLAFQRPDANPWICVFCPNSSDESHFGASTPATLVFGEVEP